MHAHLDARDYSIFVDVVVAGVHYTLGIWPAILGRTDSSPKNTLTTASGIACSGIRLEGEEFGELLSTYQKG